LAGFVANAQRSFYNKRFIVIASLLPLPSGDEYIAEPRLIGDITDRLMNNAHHFGFKGESIRKKAAGKIPVKIDALEYQIHEFKGRAKIMVGIGVSHFPD
jgi:hypothetical protein